MVIESIEQIHEKAVTNRKNIEELVLLLEERVQIEEFYSQDLERLSNKFDSTGYSTFSEFLKSLTLFASSQSLAFSSTLSKEIISSLKEQITTQAHHIKEHYIEGLKHEKRKKRLIKKAEEAKFKYWSCCEDCEQLAVSLDLESSTSKKEKLVSKLILSKSNLDSFYKSYLESIERCNKYKKTFLLRSKKILSVYTHHESDLIECINRSLKDFFELQASSHFPPPPSVHPLTLSASIEDFSHYLVYPECSFEAYEGSHPLFKNLGINSAPHIHASILEVSGADKGTQTAVENMYRNEFGVIINKAWEGESLSSQEYLHFNAMIKEHTGRKAWSWCMNLKRTQGTFVINDHGFYTIGELMVAALNECERCHDIIIAKNCIILSQTFFRHTEDAKEYLQNFIMEHTLWKNNEFWENVINSAIAEELKNQGDIEAQNEHLKSLVFCQLVSFGHIMMSFQVSEEVIGRLIKGISANYKFIDEEANEIIAAINESGRE